MTSPDDGQAQTDETRLNEAGTVTKTVDGLEKALEEERARAEGNLAGWQRAQADLQNYRRRVEQERTEVARYVAAPLVDQVLTIIDDLERALASCPPALQQFTWVDGIYLIQRKLFAVVEAQGVREIPAQGQAFDPQVHEAVVQGEGPEGQVLQVLQKGYYLHDRVLRPALVQVGRSKAGTKEQATDESSTGESPQEPPSGPSMSGP